MEINIQLEFCILFRFQSKISPGKSILEIGVTKKISEALDRTKKKSAQLVEELTKDQPRNTRRAWTLAN